MAEQADAVTMTFGGTAAMLLRGAVTGRAYISGDTLYRPFLGEVLAR